MTDFSVAEAKNNLPKLIDRALAGEEVVITRRGQAVVELRPRPAVRPEMTAEEWRTRMQAHFDAIDRLPRVNTGMTSVELLDDMYENDEFDPLLRL